MLSLMKMIFQIKVVTVKAESADINLYKMAMSSKFIFQIVEKKNV